MQKLIQKLVKIKPWFKEELKIPKDILFYGLWSFICTIVGCLENNIELAIAFCFALTIVSCLDLKQRELKETIETLSEYKWVHFLQKEMLQEWTRLGTHITNQYKIQENMELGPEETPLEKVIRPHILH